MFGKPATVGSGQKLSRFRASWLLLKESWRFLRADTELLLVPVFAAIVMVLLFGILIVGVLISGVVSAATTENTLTIQGLLFVAGSYLITAFVVALARAMVVHTVRVRTENGDASLGQSLWVALRHIPSLFLWSLISATVGLVLRAISERSERFGRLISGFLGAAWGVVTYFVVPSIVIANKSTLASLKHSSVIFQKTWGETLITNISLALAFTVLHITGVLIFLTCFFVSVELELPAMFVVAGILYIIFVFCAIAVQQVSESIIVTLLYLYATSDTPPANFNTELLVAIVTRTSAPITSAPSVTDEASTVGTKE